MKEKTPHTYLGIDVTKATLRVQTPKENFEVGNDIDGIARILKECAKVKAPLVVRFGVERALEPMINMGGAEVNVDSDGWTVRTRDGLPSAHFEHTVVVGPDGAEILTVSE